MKILFLQDDFPPHSLGGAGNVAFALAQEMLTRGHEVGVVTASPDKAAKGESIYEGLKIFTLYSGAHERWQAYWSLWNPRMSRKLKKILGDFKPDVVHAHNIRRISYPSLRLAKRSGARVFLTAHDAMLFHYGKLGGAEEASPGAQLKKYKFRYNPLRNLFIRKYLGYVDKIFAVSYALKQALEQNNIRGAEVVHNGIDAALWQAAPAAVVDFKVKHSLAGKKVILFGGRLNPAKGSRQAVRILANVVRKVPNATLLVLGPKNRHTEEMLKLARQEGVESHIVFAGWISGGELRSAYAASDVVTVLSLYLDPFPTINLEAMASKKPVVGTCFGGTPEAVEDGTTGYIVNPLDVGAAAAKVSHLLSDDAEAEKLGLAGHERVCREFSLRRQADLLYFAAAEA